jgi:hypothetical protein
VIEFEEGFWDGIQYQALKADFGHALSHLVEDGRVNLAEAIRSTPQRFTQFSLSLLSPSSYVSVHNCSFMKD